MEVQVGGKTEWKQEIVCRDLLQRMEEKSAEILGENLTGIYLHGSASMGCFQAQKSDLDLILVVEDNVSDTVKLEFLRHVVKWNEEAPAKGIELSIVKRKFCKPFVYPTPFELHFSVSHLRWYQENPEDYVNKMKGTDRDLAAHFTIIGRYGIVLYGKAVSEVFGPVPQEDYIDSILSDIENASEDIVENPVYMILNLCRVLAYLKKDAYPGKAAFSKRAGICPGEPLILSKKAGGEWGLQFLPERFQKIVEAALTCYRDGTDMVLGTEEAKPFTAYMLSEIGKNLPENLKRE